MRSFSAGLMYLAEYAIVILSVASVTTSFWRSSCFTAARVLQTHFCPVEGKAKKLAGVTCDGESARAWTSLSDNLQGTAAPATVGAKLPLTETTTDKYRKTRLITLPLHRCFSLACAQF